MLALLAGVLLAQDQGRLVATIPEGVEVYAIHFRRFGSVVSFIARKGETHWAVFGEWRSKPDLHVLDCVPSGDGRTALLLAVGLENGKPVNLFCLKDQIVEKFPDPDGRGFIWGGHSACISDDGKVVTYLVTRGKGENRRISVSVTGRNEKGSYEDCSTSSISSDGKTVAYTGGNDDKSWVVVNDDRGPEYDEVTLPAISRRNGVVAYGAEDGGQWFLVLGAKKIRVEGKARVRSVFVNPDGSAAGGILSRTEDDGGKLKFFARVVIDGKKSDEYSHVDGACLHPDGKTALYLARGLDNKKYVVVGDRKILVPEPVGAPEFSPDGKKAGYGIRVGRELRWVEVDLSN